MLSFSLYIQLILTLIVSCVTTVIIIPIAKKIAIKYDAIDYPDNRRVNKKPIPRMGGIGIIAGLIAGCFITVIGAHFFDWINPFSTFMGRNVNYIILIFGVFCMFIVGIIDDIKGLRARYKLIGQIISSTIVCSSGLVLSYIQNPFIPGTLIEFGWLSYPLTIFYLVAFANIINLIDGLDGLATGISIISAATIGFYGILSTRLDAVIFALILIGACLGFLKFNHYPASIFMGDSGSLVLGLCLGIISLLAIARTALVFSLLVPILAAGVPITDTTLAIIRRKKAHKPVNEPDRGHIHHRLLDAGFSQSKTVAIMWGWTLILSICGILFAELDGMARILSLLLAAAITGYAIFKLKLLNPVLQHYYNPRKRRKKVK